MSKCALFMITMAACGGSAKPVGVGTQTPVVAFDETMVDPGTGWFCYGYDGGKDSDCQRTDDLCSSLQKTRAAKQVGVTNCTPHEEAFCFTTTHRQESAVSKAAYCTIAVKECEMGRRAFSLRGQDDTLAAECHAMK